jgi:hypothetical protein
MYGMRRLLNLTLYAWCFYGIILSACTSTARDKAVQLVSPYFQENSGAGIRLAILEPAGEGLSPTEQRLLTRLRAVLLYDFTCFSHVVLVDQEQLDAIASSYPIQTDGVLSDEDSAAIGMLTSAQYILHGTISKREEGFSLQVAVVEIDSGARAASYEALVSFEELWSAEAMQQAFIDCAGQLGIALTETGEIAVNKLDSSGMNAALAYAKALEARKNKRTLEELHYLHAAVTQEPLLLDAQKRLAVLSALLSSGKTLQAEGGAQDTEGMEAWTKFLVATEYFYQDFLLFDIAYTNVPLIDEETGAVEFLAGLYRNDSADAMQSVINDIRGALSSLPEEERFSGWPLVPALPQDKSVSLFPINDYRVEFGLYNSNGDLLSRTELFLQSQSTFFEGELLTDSTQQCAGTFSDIDLKMQVEGSFIKILSINELDEEQLRVQNLWHIVPTQELPRINPRPIYFTQGQAAVEQPQTQPEKPLKSLDWFRFGIGLGAYFLNASENVLADDPYSLQGIVEIGVKWVTLEAFIHSSYGSLAQTAQSIGGLGSLDTANDTISYGLGADFTLIWRSFLFSLGGGYSHYPDKADTVFMQAKVDLVPESFGLGLRVGYKADLFNLEKNALEFNGKVVAGLLFWL